RKWYLGGINDISDDGGCSKDSGEQTYDVIIVQSVIQCLALFQPISKTYVNFNKTSMECTIRATVSTEEVYIREGPSLEMHPSNCNETWEVLYEVNADGSVLYGSKSDVLNAALKGDDLRIQLVPDFYIEVDDIIIINGVVCTSSVFGLSKSSWDTFEPDMYWEFIKVCEHGVVEYGRIYLGKSETPSTSSHKGMRSIWFNRRLRQSESQMNPLYCNLADGSSNCGDLYNLTDAAKEGMGIKIVENPGSTTQIVYSANRVEVFNGNCGIAIQTVWRVASFKGTTDYTKWYTTPFRWIVTLKSTSGSKETSFPDIGSGTAGPQIFSDTSGNNWFVDYCWTHSFTHDVNGGTTLGSKQELINMIRLGRRVRIVFDGYAMEADNIVIQDGLVTVQLLSQVVSKTQTQQNVGNVIIKFVRISTKGDMLTDMYYLGTSLRVESKESNMATSWFIDTRTWSLVLGTDSSGTAIHGSKLDLTEAVRSGSRLRCIVKQSPTESLIITADNIQVNTDGNIAAQFFRLVKFDDNDNSFIPFWRILILTTNGEMKETRWTIGKHEHRGSHVDYVAIDWFVDQVP
ncbi:uncharacterized protein LOC132564452, partial [Ylistrum balloti]|uniref:uncharacterized protein LOC132564452 n=1 Tax=Ylistrum balloti TaxID=509963 RepID=UPI002905D886